MSIRLQHLSCDGRLEANPLCEVAQSTEDNYLSITVALFMTLKLAIILFLFIVVLCFTCY